MKKIQLIILILIVFSQMIFCESWESHTSMNNSMGMLDVGDELIVYSNGGLVFTGTEPGEEILINSSEEWLGSNAVSSLYEYNGLLLIGTFGKGLFFYNLEEKEGKKFIINSNLHNLFIHSFAETEEFIWIGCNDGLIRMRKSSFESGNTIIEFDKYLINQNKIVYNMFFINDQVLLFTKNGIFKYDLINNSPANEEQISELIASSSVFYDNNIYFCTESELYYLDLNLLESGITYTESVNYGADYNYLNKIISTGGRLILTSGKWDKDYLWYTAVTGQGISIYNGSQWDNLSTTEIITGAAYNNDELFLAIWRNGYGKINGEELETTSFNCPVSNFFWDVEIDSKGQYWSATGTSSGRIRPYDQEGIMKFGLDEEWTVLNTSNSEILANNVYDIEIDIDDNVWLGKWGTGNSSGITVVSEDYSGYTYEHINKSNQPNLLTNVVTKIHIDDRTGVWIACYGIGTPTPGGINHISTSGQWSGYGLDNTVYNDDPISFYIDSFGKKYIGCWYSGVNTTDNFYNWDYLDYTVNTETRDILEDKYGRIWIACTKGIYILDNDDTYFMNTSTKLSKKGIGVNFDFVADYSLTEDPLRNNITRDFDEDWNGDFWVATAGGLYKIIIEEDIEDLFLKGYFAGEDPLVSNDVLSVKADLDRRRIGIGTSDGFSILEPETFPRDFEQLKEVNIYPNPSDEGYFVFDNTPLYSKIKIFTIAGEMIDNFYNKSTRFTWDYSGKSIGRGIYLYYIESPKGGEKKGKIVIK